MFKKLLRFFMFGLMVDDPDSGSTGTATKDPESKGKDPQSQDPNKQNGNQNQDPEPDNKIPYDRFKKVNDDNKSLKQKLAEIEKSKTEAEKKRLEEEGKWQEAAELAQKKATEAEERAKNAEKATKDKSREYEIGLESKMQGVNNIKDAILLVDVDDIVDNDDGSFSGIKEAVEKLKKEKPYLFSDDNGGLGVHSNKPKGNTMTTKTELLADPIAATEFKQKHPAEYDRIMESD
jgi:hypothetical protein